MAQHSIYNQDPSIKSACGMPIIPFRTKVEGPGMMVTSQVKNNMDIIDEAFAYFRINVLFKNFEIKGPGDKVLVYLFVYLSHLFKVIEQTKDQPTARKRLSDVMSLQVPAPKQKANFMAGMLQEGAPNEREAYNQYIKQLKAETINRLLQKFYAQGVAHDDLKYWVGLGKKKFLGLNYTSMF